MSAEGKSWCVAAATVLRLLAAEWGLSWGANTAKTQGPGSGLLTFKGWALIFIKQALGICWGRVLLFPWGVVVCSLTARSETGKDGEAEE